MFKILLYPSLLSLSLSLILSTFARVPRRYVGDDVLPFALLFPASYVRDSVFRFAYLSIFTTSTARYFWSVFRTFVGNLRRISERIERNGRDAGFFSWKSIFQRKNRGTVARTIDFRLVSLPLSRVLSLRSVLYVR